MPFIPEFPSVNAWIAKIKAHFKLRHHHIHHKEYEAWQYLNIEGLSDPLHYISSHSVTCSKCDVAYTATRAWVKIELCRSGSIPARRWSKRPIAEAEAQARICTQHS